MPCFSYGDLMYLNNINDRLQCDHDIFIPPEISDITIMTPSNLMRNKLINISRMFVLDMFVTLNNKKIKIVANLSKMNVLNSQIHYVEVMLIARDNFKFSLVFLF